MSKIRRKPLPLIQAIDLITWRLNHPSWKQRTQTACAKELKTPLRTYLSWERGESRIPGAVVAYIEKHP